MRLIITQQLRHYLTMRLIITQQPRPYMAMRLIITQQPRPYLAMRHPHYYSRWGIREGRSVSKPQVKEAGRLTGRIDVPKLFSHLRPIRTEKQHGSVCTVSGAVTFPHDLTFRSGFANPSTYFCSECCPATVITLIRQHIIILFVWKNVVALVSHSERTIIVNVWRRTLQ
jgi:hypothetical protein